MQSGSREKLVHTATFVALVALFVIILFWEPFTSGKSLWGPDNLPYGAIERDDQLPGAFTGTWYLLMCGLGGQALPLIPVNLLRLILPPLSFHVWSYIFDVLLLVAAAAYFLRGRGLRGIPVYAGAIALGFTPHTFTLIAAGHFGKFNMMPMAVFMLACIDRGVERRSWIHFAWAGVAAAFGFSAQPDIMMIIGILGAAYGLYKLITCWPRDGHTRYIVHNAIGATLAALFAVSMGFSSVRGAQQHTLKTRTEISGKTDKEKWIFATNWSLPPEEALEFIAPCFFGVETGDAKGPYWGRMGRTLDWRKHRQGLMNLRQHTVYLGAFPIGFGLLALAWAVTRRRAPGAETDDAEAHVARSTLRRDIIFWSTVALLAFLFALGRNFPLYRLYYALPYAGNLRAPVKFLHVLEISLSFLFAAGLSVAFGQEALKSGSGDAAKKSTRPHSGAFWTALVLAALMLLGMLFVGVLRSSLTSYWAELGLKGHEQVIIRNALRGLLQAAVMFGVSAFALRCMARAEDPARTGRWVGVVILVCLTIDLGLVNRRYVKVADLNAFLRSNPLVERLKQEREPYRISCPFPGAPFAQWRSIMFRAHLIDALEPPKQRNMESDYQAYFAAFQRNPLRLWELTNTRFVVGPMQALRSLLDGGHCGLVQAFDIDARGRIVGAGGRGAGRFALVRFAKALPRAIVYHKWISLEDDDRVLSGLASAETNPQQYAILSGPTGRHDTGRSPTAVTSLDHDRTSIHMSADIPDEGLLVVNDRFQEGWTATDNGRPVPIERVNYIMRGVKLSAGRHEVVMRYQPYRGHFFMAVGSLSILVVLTVGTAALHYLRGRRSATP